MYLSNVCLLKKLIYTCISKILFPLHNHYNMNYSYFYMCFSEHFSFVKRLLYDVTCN